MIHTCTEMRLDQGVWLTTKGWFTKPGLGEGVVSNPVPFESLDISPPHTYLHWKRKRWFVLVFVTARWSKCQLAE